MATKSNHPHFTLTVAERTDLTAFVTQSAKLPPRPAPPITGERVFSERHCAACHAREMLTGLAPQVLELAQHFPEYSTLVPAMTPPSLTGVGDKLPDAVLAAQIKRGEKPYRDYLAVRMPRFNLSEAELAVLVRHFVDHDRIPPNAPDARLRLPQNLPRQSELEKAGEKLVVAGSGFGCTSCHGVGGFEPSKAPVNARGPNLSLIGTRTRAEWFYRWCRNPARLIPGQEMPAVTVPVKGVLGEKIDHQLAAVWAILNKPGFEPKDAGPLRIVRRSGNPKSSEPAVVGTDVFKADGRTYIKPLVIGLPNRHNILFDFETGRLARWWLGDTMEQHTKGKSWHWQTEMPDVLQSSLREAEFFLLVDGKTLAPRKQGQFAAKLVQWLHSAGAAHYTYELEFRGTTEDKTVHFLIKEQIAPRPNGLLRTIDVRNPGMAELKLRLLGSEALQQATIPDDSRSLTVPDRFTIRASQVIAADGTLTFAKTAQAESSRLTLDYSTDQVPPPSTLSKSPVVRAQQKLLAVMPGMTATRLPLDTRIMPTGFAWSGTSQNGNAAKLLIASLEGRVWAAHDSDGDGLEDTSQPISDELASPYGIAAPADNPSAIDVAAKYGIVRLRLDETGRAQAASILADGWGHTDDYHDWAVGFVATPHGYLVALPCQQDNRSPAAARHRGQVLDIRLSPGKPGALPTAALTPLTSGHRFPMGLAKNRAGDVFVTDNQGNYNPFNELNHLQLGKDYGFINAIDKNKTDRPPLTPPAINIPHPWTRSVNGICFLQSSNDLWGPFEDHLIGCEYDTRRLIRMSLQKVGDTYQGACYPLSLENPPGENFLGPISCAVSPRGDLYIGSIRDSGWGGGANVGEVVRVAPPTDWKTVPAGIAEVKAIRGGFTIDFTQPVDAALASDAKNYSLESFTRESTPAYGGPDKNRRVEKIAKIELSPDRRRATLHLDEQRRGYVYEFHVKNVTGNGDAMFFPAEAYYTLNTVPAP